MNFSVCDAASEPALCSEDLGGGGGSAPLVAGPDNTAQAESAPITFATPGRYCVRSEYFGDAGNYRETANSSRETCVNVRQASASLSPTDDFYRLPHDANYTSSVFGGVITNDLWPDGTTVTAVLGTGPDHEAPSGFTLNADGSFSYTPASGYSGPDSFTYTLLQQPGNVSSAPATVEFDVVPEDDPLMGTKQRGTKQRGTKQRELGEVSLVTYSACRSRFVWANPQITLPVSEFVADGIAVPGSTFLRVSAALYDVDGQRIASTDGYIVNDFFYSDPFQPTVLTFPVWSTPAPAGGAYVEVLVEVDPDTPEAYNVNGTVICAT